MTRISSFGSETQVHEKAESNSINTSTEGDVLISEKGLALRWDISVRTLQNQRVLGAGITYVKIGRTVRYRLRDVIEFENGALRRSTSEGGSQ